MINATLNSKKTTVLICLALVMVIVLGWSLQRTQAAVSASIMYFVPASSNEFGQAPTPDDFMDIGFESEGYSSIREIGYASDWKVIEQLIAEDTLDALIVHHAAQDMVNWERTKELFQRHGLVVAGIGIPGDELANLLGAPALYDSYADGRDFDYFIYSMYVSGEPVDVANILASRLTGAEEREIESPLSFGAGVGHGYFSEGQESLNRFLGQIAGSLNQ